MITDYVEAVRTRVRIWLGDATPGSEKYEVVRQEFFLTPEQMLWIYKNTD